MIHPLINPDSKHYTQNGREGIQDIEDSLTVDEMIGACSFNIMKYTLRLDAKGQKESNLKKIETYKNYKDLLLQMRNKYQCGYMRVSNAYNFCGVEVSYA